MSTGFIIDTFAGVQLLKGIRIKPGFENIPSAGVIYCSVRVQFDIDERRYYFFKHCNVIYDRNLCSYHFTL